MSEQQTLGEETEYVSESTIDNEPKPEPKREAKERKTDDNGQGSLFDEEEQDKKHREYLATNTPGQVAYKLTLAIDGGHFKNTVVFSGEKVPSESFCEYLMQSLNGAYFQQQIRGICGEQITTPKQEDMFPARGDSNAEVAPVSADTQAEIEKIDAEEKKSDGDSGDDTWSDDTEGESEIRHVDTVDHEKVLNGEV